MRKTFYLLSEYIRSAGLSLLVIVVISALAMSGLTVSAGRIASETEKYDKLRNSGLSDCFYGSRIKPDANLTEKIKTVNGVVDIIKRPDTVNFKPNDGSDGLFSMKLFTKEHYECANLNFKGSGFDYDSNDLECIIASEYFDKYSIGDVLSVKIPAKKNGEYITADFRIKGIVKTPQSVLSMSGGGSSVDAAMIYEDASFIIVKDCEALRDLAGGSITKSYLETFFIRLDNKLTEKEKTEAIDELSKYLTLQTVDEVLKTTKEQLKETVSSFLPVIIFCVLYSILTLVGMEILILYKTSEETAVCRCLGMSKARLASTVCIAKAVTIIVSFALCCIINRLFYSIPAVSSGTVYHARLLAPALILGVFEIIIAVVISVVAAAEKSMKSSYERV